MNCHTFITGCVDSRHFIACIFDDRLNFDEMLRLLLVFSETEFGSTLAVNLYFCSIFCYDEDWSILFITFSCSADFI